MKLVEKFVVVPFRSIKGRSHSAEMREARSEESATRMAVLMAERFAGVAAFEVHVDEETGEMHAPRLLAAFGKVPEMDNVLEDAA